MVFWGGCGCDTFGRVTFANRLFIPDQKLRRRKTYTIVFDACDKALPRKQNKHEDALAQARMTGTVAVYSIPREGHMIQRTIRVAHSTTHRNRQVPMRDVKVGGAGWQLQLIEVQVVDAGCG